MPDISFRGIVKEGQFRPDDLAGWAGKLGRLEGKRVQCSMKRESTGRTLSQNRLLWGVVYATLSEWSGHEPEELHEYFKELFLGQSCKELPSGERMMVRASTSSLDVEAFSEYIDKVYRWAAHRGCYIPSAEEVAS
jgi:hypothetical protein